MSLYSQRGVSAQKEEVHKAIQKLDAGLYDKAFCKIFPDYLGGDDQYVNIMHADGAGTKSILAYLYWKETGDLGVWKGIAQDAIVMNLDDLLCVGVYDNLIFNSTIDRNKMLIPGEVLEQIINGSQDLFDQLKKSGVRIHYLGGETADVGDVVRTIAVNGTLTARWRKDRLITNEKIQPGDVIVGLASFGQAVYENSYNSGIGSNGLTSARHDILKKAYRRDFSESFDPALSEKLSYIGPYALTDTITIEGKEMEIGKLILSPTRTYAPVVKSLLENHFQKIHGLIHCSGGGQTKCLKYTPEKTRIMKDNLFTPPMVFQLIQQASGSDDREMYQVFNMGCRLEIYTSPEDAETMIRTATEFGVEARIIGRVEASDKKELYIQTSSHTLHYEG